MPVTQPPNPRPPGQDAHDAEVVAALSKVLELRMPTAAAFCGAELCLLALDALPASARLALARRLCPEAFAPTEPGIGVSVQAHLPEPAPGGGNWELSDEAKAHIERIRQASWPTFCRDTNSCARHRACMYFGCRHQGDDITPAVDAIITASERTP